MRAAVCTVLLLSWVSIAAAEAPKTCAPAECERTCEAKGDGKACVRIAELYWEGKNGHRFDPTKAFRFAKKACDAGEAFGCAVQGLLHQDGIGTAWAPALAVAAYERACKGGAGVGCYNLAGMYSGAHGVDYDQGKYDALMKLAESHWQAACKGAEPRWCTNAAYLVRRARGANAQAEAYALDQRACDHGVTVGCVEALGGAHLLGKITRDALIQGLEKLCKDGEPSACTQAGGYLDDTRGIELMKRGCELGDRGGCELLGGIYSKGEKISTDFKAMRRYHGMACDRGASASCLSLARDAIDIKSPEAPSFAQRGCQMGNGDACDLLAQLKLGLGDQTAGVRWATEGCRMASVESCRRLIALDAELPSIPAPAKKRLYTEACEAQNKAACKRLKALLKR